MKKLIAFLLSLFQSVPADKNFAGHVLGVFPKAIVCEDLLAGTGLHVTVVVLPGTIAGFPDSLTSFVQSGDGVLTVVITGKAADYVANAVGLTALVPSSVRSYLVGLLKSSGVVAQLAALSQGSKDQVVVAALEAASPFIVNALEPALGSYNGCVTVK